MKPTIIIDTREKTPWGFDDEYEIERSALESGDYRLNGTDLVIERKSLDDFVNTVIHQWPRFKKEVIRLKEFKNAWVIVEATIGDVYRHSYTSRAHPNSVMGKAAAITRLGVKVFFAGNRVEAIQWFRVKIAEAIVRSNQNEKGKNPGRADIGTGESGE